MVFRGPCSATEEHPEVSDELQDKDHGEGVPVGDPDTVTAGLENIDQHAHSPLQAESTEKDQQIERGAGTP